MSWFLKGNSRRFFRVDMPIRFYAVPKEKLYSEEVFFNGIEYMSQSYYFQEEKLRSKVRVEIERIQEHKDVISGITNEMFSNTKIVMEYLKKHSSGIKVTSDPGYWINKKTLLDGFPKIDLLKTSSPKTYSILNSIEEKFLSRLKSLFQSVEKSTTKEIYSTFLEEGFHIDSVIFNIKMNEKLKKVPIARYFIALYEYFELNNHIYEIFNNDHQMANEPSFWKERNVNISACGMGVSDIRQFEQYQVLDLKIYYPETKEIFRFDGKIIASKINKETGKNFTTVDFIFPTSKEQLGLLSYIQLRECQQTIKSISDMRFISDARN